MPRPRPSLRRAPQVANGHVKRSHPPRRPLRRRLCPVDLPRLQPPSAPTPFPPPSLLPFLAHLALCFVGGPLQPPSQLGCLGGAAVQSICFSPAVPTIFAATFSDGSLRSLSPSAVLRAPTCQGFLSPIGKQQHDHGQEGNRVPFRPACITHDALTLPSGKTSGNLGSRPPR